MTEFFPEVFAELPLKMMFFIPVFYSGQKQCWLILQRDILSRTAAQSRTTFQHIQRLQRLCGPSSESGGRHCLEGIKGVRLRQEKARSFVKVARLSWRVLCTGWIWCWSGHTYRLEGARKAYQEAAMDWHRPLTEQNQGPKPCAVDCRPPFKMAGIYQKSNYKTEYNKILVNHFLNFWWTESSK